MENTEEKETRTERLGIRLTPLELKNWSEAAKSEDRNIADFVRALVNKILRRQNLY